MPENEVSRGLWQSPVCCASNPGRPLIGGAPAGEDAAGGDVLSRELTTKSVEGPCGKVGPDIGHDLEIEVGIVDAHQAQAENLVHIQEVADVGAREAPASEAGAALLDGAEVGRASCRERVFITV